MIDKKKLKEQFSKDWKKHYKVEFLVNKGFKRKKCSSCGGYFWTLDSDRTVCADSSCVGYEFLGKPTKKFDYVQTWNEIEKYFKKKNHTPIQRYPTVCRWRDDLYFTNASIIDFQPYVVTGEIEPPANPLIVPQPSIRFGDIENVGVTGQHYSSFIMFGQHAFNSKQTGLFYWKNEALEHDFNYVTKVLGAKKEDICFQEEVWAGGGTFGPCIEYCVDGVELGNCVFMQYKDLGNGKSEELKTKVIDMGAGLERLAWFTNGTPTSYEITFGPVIKKMKKIAGIDIDKKLFLEYSKLSGQLDVDSLNIVDRRKEIAKQLNVSEEELFGKLRPLQGLYATADHIKTLMYTITDGMLPSNSGGGYNLRMLARRVFAFDKEFNFGINLADIVRGHAKHLKEFDPSLLKGVETTIEVLNEEKRKYEQTKTKGRQKIESLINQAGKGNKINEKTLMTLYESDGIPIELIKEEAKKKGVNIKIPSNFYGLLAKQNEKETNKKKKLNLDVSGFKKTKEMYYANQEIEEFTATVQGITGNAIILDKTYFYPEGGGQEADLGLLGDAKVVDVQKHEGIILHFVSKPELFKKGKKVFGKINMKRRNALIKHHSGAHLLNAAAKQVLGEHIWQAGAQKSVDKAHLDLTHFKRITKEELRQIEKIVNEMISANVPVTVELMSRNKAEEKYGFRIYQGGFVPGKTIRIINSQGIDVEACGGLHVKKTGDVGFFKILKREGIQDGIERIVYACSGSALEHLSKLEAIIEKASENLSVPIIDLPKTAEKFFNEWKSQKKIITELQKEIAKLKAKDILSSDTRIVKEYLEGISIETLIPLARKIISKKPNVIIFFGSGIDLLIAAGPDSGKHAGKELIKILKQIPGKGGGSREIARARLQNKLELMQFFK